MKKSELLNIVKIANKTAESVNSNNGVNILVNAAIMAGLGFFGALLGISIVTDNMAQACFGAGISSGFQFFTSLAIQKGLKRNE